MKKTFLIIFILIINILIYPDTRSDNIKSINLTIKDAVDLALKNNLNIESKRIDLSKSKWSMITSWNKFIPDITMGAKLSKRNQVITVEEEELTLVGPIVGNAYGVIPETVETYDISLILFWARSLTR